MSILPVVLFAGSMIVLGLHEDWLMKGSSRRWLGWILVLVGVMSGLSLILLLQR